MAEFSMKKPTKFVPLTFITKSGQRIVGEFHVPAGTSSACRPSDMFKEVGSFIGLVNAKITLADGTVREVGYIQLSRDSIDWVEFPGTEQTWLTGTVAPTPGH